MPAETIILTVELIQQLDIQVGRLIGLVKNPMYSSIVNEYELDSTQCLLWWDISQLLSYVLDKHDYEDITCDHKRLGLEAKKVMADLDSKFMHLKQLLAQYDILHDNSAIGTILHESVEDITLIYKSIEKELANIFTTQSDISKIVDTE